MQFLLNMNASLKNELKASHAFVYVRYDFNGIRMIIR